MNQINYILQCPVTDKFFTVPMGVGMVKVDEDIYLNVQYSEEGIKDVLEVFSTPSDNYYVPREMTVLATLEITPTQSIIKIDTEGIWMSEPVESVATTLSTQQTKLIIDLVIGKSIQSFTGQCDFNISGQQFRSILRWIADG